MEVFPLSKLMLTILAAGLLFATASKTYADIARPSPSPAPGKLVLHTSMTVIPDKKIYEARLQISQDSLNELRAAMTDTSTTSLLTGLSGSPVRTIIAGLCLFLSLSIGGVWVLRSTQPRGQKAIALLLFGIAVLGAATIVTQANVGPPPAWQWRNLSQNLNAGKPTHATIDIEIVPEGSGMKLIVPVKPQ